MDRVGIVAIVAVLVVGVFGGWWRRRTDGRFHTVASSRPAGQASSASGGVAVDGESAVADAADPVADAGTHGADDRVVVPDREEEPGVIERDAGAAGEVLAPELLAQLGVEPARATLLQFSSAFCAPCRAVRRVSAEVAGLLPGVRHVEVDAESHLDAVRALGIWRTPTLLVLDAEGRVVKRATGVPAKPQLIAVLGEVLPATH